MTNKVKNWLNLKKFSFLGKIFLTFIGLYLVVSPFLPSIVYSFSQPSQNYTYVDEEAFHKLSDANKNFKNLKIIPKENTLIIPKIGVDGLIHEGESDRTLDKGIWHRPKSSTPDKGGNTVLAAHRFMYTQGPITFYHLDKLVLGDKITVIWNKKQYDYEVIEIKEVLPTAIEIENNTDEPILTLFTCTPLFSTERRLVVVAKLVE